jgi:hypothetical protein
MAGADPVRVAFIGGSGRCGSTLLELLLGRVPGFVAVGELRHVWERSFAGDVRCACGEPFSRCEFWTAVVAEAFGGPVDGRRVARLRHSVERFRRWPYLTAAMPQPAAYRLALDRYTGLLGRLYRAIRKHSGAEVVVDASKHPAHGQVLRRMPELELSVIHLVRDSRAVVHSLQRRKDRPDHEDREDIMPTLPPVKAALNWDLTNGLCSRLARSHPRSIRLRYEDLARDPDAAVERVLRLVQGDVAGREPIADGPVDVGTQHTLSGNPIRFERGPLRIAPDLEWRTAMPPGRRATVTALTFPLLRAYGYGAR